MKIKKLKLKNFAQFIDFECVFDDKVTYLVGMNGAGKTTVGLTAIWACLKGIAEKSNGGQLLGERFRFIGPDKATADIELVLYDSEKGVEIKIKNQISKQGNKIRFEVPDGCTLTEDWLKDLLSVAFLSTKNFTQLNGRDQSLALGINTEGFDGKTQELKQEYTLLNREFKAFGLCENIEKVERMSLSDLLRQKQEMDEFNMAQERVTQETQAAMAILSELHKKEYQLMETLKRLREEIGRKDEAFGSLENPQPPKDTRDILDQISNIEQNNRKADLFERIEKKRQLKNGKGEELRVNRAALAAEEGKRLAYIKAFDFNIDGLSVDESGGLLLDKKPIREPYFSKGELELIVAQLYSSLNPELKTRFIDDFEMLDDKNQQEIIERLFRCGFQVIVAVINEPAQAPGSKVFLQECQKKEEA